MAKKFALCLGTLHLLVRQRDIHGLQYSSGCCMSDQLPVCSAGTFVAIPVKVRKRRGGSNVCGMPMDVTHVCRHAAQC